MGRVNLSITKAPVCLWAILFLFLSTTSFSQTTTIPGHRLLEGVILDQQNKPIPNANVWALGEQDMTKPITTTSDVAGRFVLREVPVGKIYVFGFKESEGYPYGFSAFYMTKNDRSWAVVETKSEDVVSSVTLHLGPKSAYLKVNATDENGMSVPLGYQLDRDDMPGSFNTSVPTDHRLVGVGFINGVMLVPPVPFRLTVQADGYAPWHYGGKNWSGKAGLIRLKSGQTLNLKVRLRRK